ncbi:MerR family transcriptional regulator [Streptomyces sp. NBC_01190]|uniref:MerR family transcriptional regulator n=1 Tax=Streptomyces sp. NBC_01190 TaxID=2903767 RepID=UPI003866B0AB|nr:MerR family transcriptional regulator [Streptomyces sp. NBC_01190]
MSTAAEQQRAYRIEELSHLSGATVRNIRAYTDRGLLPKPERRGRANVYGDAHLIRLGQIARLLERGYTLASIKELLAAWDAGTDLGGVLGLVDEVDRPWSDEQSAQVSLDELVEAFGGVTDLEAVEEALRLGVLEPVPGTEDRFVVPSPKELAVAVELYAAGVPLSAITGHLRELRGQVEHISERFLEFTTEYVFQRFFQQPPNEGEAEEVVGLIRRLRPLAQQIVDVELARAMRILATEHMRRSLGDILPPGELADLQPGSPAAPAPAAMPARVLPQPSQPSQPLQPLQPLQHPKPPRPADDPPVPVPLPAATVAAVRDLVGTDDVSAFVAAAADREVAARRLDTLTDRHRPDRPPNPPAAPVPR